MKARSLSFLAVFFVSLAAWTGLLFAEEAKAPEQKGPEEPAFVLPRLVFRIDDLTSQSFPAALPRSTELPFVASVLPLADPPVPPLSETLLHPKLPEGDGTKALPAASTVAAQGAFGAGTQNHLLGSLSLYKTDEAGNFRLRFSHDGSDGWDFHAPGTGYSSREENLDGRAVFHGKSGETVLEGSLIERDTGLQEKAAASAVVSRYLKAGLSSVYRPGEDFTMHGALTGTAASRLLALPSGTTLSREEAEYSLKGDGRVRYGTERLGLFLEGGYQYRAVPDYGDLLKHRLNAAIGMDYSPADRWNAEGSFGVAWNDDRQAFLPFSLRLEGALGDDLAFVLRGGRRAEERNYFDLWNGEPLLGLTETIGDGRTWFGGAQAEVSILSGLFSLKLSFDAEYREDGLKAGDFLSARAAFPVAREDFASFPVSAEIRSSPVQGLTLRGSWTTLAGERSLFEPRHAASLSADFAPVKGRWGLSFSGNWKDDVTLPDLGLRGFLRPFEGIEFSLAAEDCLAPFLEDGRIRHDPFVDPGFRVTLKTLVAF